MTLLDEIKHKANLALSEGSLVVNQALFDTLGVTSKVLEDAVVPEFVIQGCTLTAETDRIRVEGKTSLLNLAEVVTVGVFEVIDNIPHLSLDFDLPENWGFRQSFPDLPEYFDFSSKGLLVGSLESFFYKLNVSKGKFQFSTRNDFADQLGLEKVPGFSITTMVDFAGPLGVLKTVLNGQASLELNGLIQKTGVSSLYGKVPISLELGSFSLSELKIELYCALFEGTSPENASGIRFHGDAAVKDKVVHLTSDLNLGSRYIELEGKFDNFAFPTLADLSGFIGQSDLRSFLPDIPDTNARFTLDWLKLGVSLQSKKLSAIAIGFSTDLQIEVLENRLSLSGMTFETTIISPFETAKREVRCLLSGNLQLANTTLKVFSSFPEFVLFGTLPEGETIALSGFLTQWGVASEGIPSDMTISALLVSVGLRTKEIAFHLRLEGLWEIVTGGKRLTLESLEMQVGIKVGKVAGRISGMAQLADFETEISADLTTEGWEINSHLVNAKLSTLVNSLSDDLTFPAEIPDIGFDDVNLTIVPKSKRIVVDAVSQSSWNIPVGINGLALTNLSMNLAREGGKAGSKATLSGKLHIGASSFALNCVLPGELVLEGDLPQINLSQLLQEFCGSDIIRDIPAPAAALASSLSTVHFIIRPKSEAVNISATSEYGQVRIEVRKLGAKWGFSVAFEPPANWKLSKLASELAVLDGLDMSSTALVLSSVDNDALTLPALSSPVSVKKGFNLAASLDLSALGADKVLNTASLQIYAAIGGTPSNIVLEAAFRGLVKINENTAFGDIRFRLTPSPQNFSVELLGTVFAQIGESKLQFIGGMKVQPRSALLKTTMKGDWIEPFGVKGVIVSNLAIELGLSFPPLLPSVGFAGTLQVGDFKGSVAVKFSAAFPSQSMLAIEFNQLYLMDIIKQFCGAKIAAKIPASIQKTVLLIGLENVKIYIVPQTTTIGELVYEQGFIIRGKLVLWGLEIETDMSLDYTEGVLVKGSVSRVELAGLFSLTGSQGRERASLLFDLRRSAKPRVDIEGAVTILGFTREVTINFSDSGFYFRTSAKIFDLFEATIEASGSDLQNGGSFMLSVMMKQDLLEYLREKATAAIDAAAKESIRKIEAAQRDVDNAQAEVNRLLGLIDSTRSVIAQERARDTKRLQDAQAEVQRAQADVNSLDNQIASVRRTIEGERDRDTRRIQSARRDVQNAQDKVNGLTNQINNANNRIEQLKQAIRNKENWYNNLGFWDKWNPANWGSVVAENTPRVAEISGLGIELGGLYSGQHIAWGALEAAKGVLRGIEAGAVHFPIEADPRMAGLISAKATANGILEAGKGIVRGIELGAKTFPIDADPRIVGLFTAYGTATGGLKAAQGILEVTKSTVGGLADIGKFIVDIGLGGLIDIKSASFYASLAVSSGGRVSLNVELLFMKKDKHSLTLDLNFHNPLSAAEALAKSLLPA